MSLRRVSVRLAGSLGVTQEPTDRLEHIARLAWRTLPGAEEADLQVEPDASADVVLEVELAADVGGRDVT